VATFSYQFICINVNLNLYVLMPHNQKIGQKRSIKIANRSFEGVAKFKYLGTTLADQNCMHEEISSRLNSGNACDSASCPAACCLGT
jgi:hypothetical protein